MVRKWAYSKTSQENLGFKVPMLLAVVFDSGILHWRMDAKQN
jgi:hypothetical protein